MVAHRGLSRWARNFSWLSILLGVLFIVGRQVSAQAPAPNTGRDPVKGGAGPAPSPPMNKGGGKATEQKIPPVEPLDLITKDGVDLKARYYPGWRTEGSLKDVVPVMLLHGWKGSGADMERLAITLQSRGHAVIVPDLRGHGGSTRTRGGRGGEIDAALLRPADFANMVRFDMETIKTYLLARNNAGDLNIEKLCVVGAEMGASIASIWAATDWSWPQLVTAKQGRDVKALVLISPEISFKGLRTTDALGLNHPAVRSELSIMVAFGNEDPKFLKDAKRIYSMLEKYHPMPPENERQKRQDLFYFDGLETKLQGTALLNERALNVDKMILKFIDWRLSQRSIPWAERGSPL